MSDGYGTSTLVIQVDSSLKSNVVGWVDTWPDGLEVIVEDFFVFSRKVIAGALIHCPFIPKFTTRLISGFQFQFKTPKIF